MRKICLVTILSLFFIGCISKKENQLANDFVIETNYGNIKIHLYDETKLHKENFNHWVKEGFYNDMIFHRVIKDFMIQIGDVEYKKNCTNAELEQYNYTFPSEIKTPQLFHKRGAIAAARTPDEYNPHKESSSTQFYIVTGRKFTNEELDIIEDESYKENVQKELKKLFDINGVRIQKLIEEGNDEELNLLQEEIVTKAENLVALYTSFLFTDIQRSEYINRGGAPFLDGKYTVFGEVVEGMDVVEKISQVSVDENDKPLEEVKRIRIKVEK